MPTSGQAMDEAMATASDALMEGNPKRIPSQSSEDIPSNRLARFTTRRALWICIAATMALITILALVLGLVLGLRRHHSSSSSTAAAAALTDPLTVDSLTVDLGYSKYIGSNVNDGVSQWLGIRYAAAPEGDLRFRAPQDPVSNGMTIEASTRGPMCFTTPSTTYDAKFKEDCLFLNVFAPTKVNGSHPVYVFFQGGGFNDLSEPNLDGNSLINAADHDLVIVTFNYRVGPWGFLASKEVQADGQINAGLLDQRKVLHWIQQYIHLFGGDPKHVTIGGASAGGASVDLHMSAYSGRDDGLFHAAAAESQSFGAQLTIAESQYQYDALVSRVNCSSASDTLQCLRSVDIKILAQNNINIPTPGGAGKTPLFMYSNVIDGNFTTDYTYKLFAEGKFVHVPSIFGDDTNEGTIFTPSQINNVTEMNAFLKNNFVKLTSEQLAQIDNLYPNSSTTQYPGRGSYWRTAATAYGEMRYNCPGINISSTIAAANVPSYNYHWDVLSSVNANNGLGVTHTAELGSIWGTSVSPERALNPTIQAYWTSFLRTKDPNTYKLASAPTWEVFGTTGSGPRMHFVNALGDVGMENVDQGQMERCAYLSGIGIALGQ